MGEIGSIIIPIFSEVPLLTIKQVNFNKFKQIYEMKKSGQYSTKELYRKALSIKEEMNLQLDYDSLEVKTWEQSNRQTNRVTPYWLLGFIEAEGTFGVKNNLPYFQVAQHECSLSTLDMIASFLENTWEKNIFNYSNLPPISINITKTRNDSTGVYSYVITNLDILYYFILPLFSNMTFRSRKYIDFKLWGIIVLLCKRGYSYSIAGIKLLVLIAQNMNDNRYSTNKDTPPLLSKSDIDQVFNLEPPIRENPLNFKSHQTLVKALVGTKARPVDVFKDGVLVGGPPFPSFRAAQRALGWNPDQVIIGRYIDTNKAYKRKGDNRSYIFQTARQ